MEKIGSSGVTATISSSQLQITSSSQETVTVFSKEDLDGKQAMVNNPEKKTKTDKAKSKNSPARAEVV